MALAEKLNRYGVSASLSRSVVSLEAVPDDIDDLCGEDGTVTDPEFSAFLDELCTYEAYVDEHSEGADRGGYVLWVDHDGESAYYDHGDCEWC